MRNTTKLKTKHDGKDFFPSRTAKVGRIGHMYLKKRWSRNTWDWGRPCASRRHQKTRV